LLGINDDKTTHGWAPPGRSDAQSHLANLLRAEVDPLPPFVAESREHDGKTIVVMRIFESADVPHIVRGTGALYVRTSAGKQPIDDHRTLLEMAQRGRDAADKARERIRQSEVVNWWLPSPYMSRELRPIENQQLPDEMLMSVALRAAPLTVSAHTTEWPISGAAAEACFQLLTRFPERYTTYPEPIIEPHGRGVTARRAALLGGLQRNDWGCAAAADSLGVIGVGMRVERPGVIPTDLLRRNMIRPTVDALAVLLDSAEVVGRVHVDMRLVLPGVTIQGETTGAKTREHGIREPYVATDVTMPMDDEQRAALARLLEREIARSVGLARWEREEEERGEPEG
jgi:hypothetical protein